LILAAPALAALTPPARWPACGDAVVPVLGKDFLDLAPSKPHLETCEHGLRQRRDFREIEGTDGYAIITQAGLRPFHPLTPRQAAIVAERQGQRAREQAMDRFGAEVRVRATLPVWAD
jgi:hypothetical protein